MIFPNSLRKWWGNGRETASTPSRGQAVSTIAVTSSSISLPTAQEQNEDTLLDRVIRIAVSQLHYYFFISAAWLVILVSLRERRSYQDSWVLEGVFPFVLLLLITFIWVVSRESRSSHIAMVSASFVTVLRWIPGLKYKWAYGTAVDQMVHIASIQKIMATGFPPNGTPYTNIPGMHVLMSAVGLLNNATVDEIIGIAFPLILGLIPLLIYFLTSQVRITPLLQNQIIIATALAFDPYFLLIQGSPFGVFLLILVLVFFLSREAGNIYIQLPLTIGLLGSIVALIFGHGVSSLIFIILIFGMQIGLMLINRIRQVPVNDTISSSARRLFIFTIVAFTIWWIYQAQGVFTIFVSQIWSFISRLEIEKVPIPSRVMELNISDLSFILLSLHGNTIILLVLAGIGVFVLWKRRQMLTPRFQNILISFLILEVGVGIILVGQLISGFGNLEYFRLLGYAVALSPLFIGASLWALQGKSRVGWLLFLSATLFISLFQAFPYQPAIAGGDSLSAEIGADEYLLYLHAVVTDYQVNMLSFVQKYVKPEQRFMSDRVTRDEAYRFWGPELAQMVGIRNQASATANLDAGEWWQFMMLHRAGIAGPYTEQVEVRQEAQIERILQSPQYAVVYSNGESYVLVRRLGRMGN